MLYHISMMTDRSFYGLELRWKQSKIQWQRRQTAKSNQCRPTYFTKWEMTVCIASEGQRMDAKIRLMKPLGLKRSPNAGMTPMITDGVWLVVLGIHTILVLSYLCDTSLGFVILIVHDKGLLVFTAMCLSIHPDPRWIWIPYAVTTVPAV